MFTKKIYKEIQNFQEVNIIFPIIVLLLGGIFIGYGQYYESKSIVQAIFFPIILYLIILPIPLIMVSNMMPNYSLDKKTMTTIKSLLFNGKNKNYLLIEYIFNNPTVFPAISVEKLKKYDFDNNFHMINSLMINNDYQIMIDKMDIWFENNILFFNQMFYIIESENMNTIKYLVESINSFMTIYPQLKFPPFQNYYIENNKKYLTVQGLKDYYAQLVVSSNI